MTFPQTIGTVMREGFESYMIDFRRAVATYYLPDGDSFELPMHKIDVPVAPRFDVRRFKLPLRKRNNMHMPAGQEQSVESTGLVAEGVDFRGATAARAADCLVVLPPFAPDAERCALTEVLSTMARSDGSPKAASTTVAGEFACGSGARAALA